MPVVFVLLFPELFLHLFLYYPTELMMYHKMLEIKLYKEIDSVSCLEPSHTKNLLVALELGFSNCLSFRTFSE